MALDAVYECSAHACGVSLYDDELWLCADCGDRFCEEHIEDVGGVAQSVYLCVVCSVRRSRKPAAAGRVLNEERGAA